MSRDELLDLVDVIYRLRNSEIQKDPQLRTKLNYIKTVVLALAMGKPHKQIEAILQDYKNMLQGENSVPPRVEPAISSFKEGWLESVDTQEDVVKGIRERIDA